MEVLYRIVNSLKRAKNLDNFRVVVPADNSCLFTSINYCMCGEVCFFLTLALLYN